MEVGWPMATPMTSVSVSISSTLAGVSFVGTTPFTSPIRRPQSSTVGTIR